MAIKPLDWDSAFFKRRIGRIDTAQTNNLIQSIETGRGQFDTLYIFSSIPQPQIIALGGILVDEKVTWTKSPRSQPEENEFFIPPGPSPKLLELFLASGEYSRFRIDPVFAPDFQRFYSQWMINAISGSYDDFIFCSGSPDKPSGVLTLRQFEDSMNIGIIAVSSSSRGQGLGRLLIRKAENMSRDYRHLTVPTQAANHVAMDFYKKMGFEVRSREYVYHLHFKL